MNQQSDSAGDSILTESIQWDSSWPELADREEVDSLAGFMEERFGIKRDIFNDYLFFKKKNSWWILRNSQKLYEFSTLKIEMAGIRAFQKVGQFLKPTTRFTQVFGSLATKCFIELNEETLIVTLKGERFSLDLPDTGNGYLILRFNKRAIGLGLYIDGEIHPLLPRSIRSKIFC